MSDVTRAVHAVRKAGVPVVHVQVDKSGTITVISGEPEPRPPAEPDEVDHSWDDVKDAAE
jgi:hypothetical protein